MRHYTEDDLHGLIGLDDAIECLRAAFLEFATGAARVQLRIPTEFEDLRLNTMAAVVPGAGYCGAKVYTALGSRFSFVILLFSIEDGGLVATFDARGLTRLRTAAVSVLAASCLARSASRTLAVFGTGVQAAGHVRALTQKFPIRTVYVVGRDQAEAFAREMSELTGCETAAVKVDFAVSRADIIVTATRSLTPLFDGKLVPAGSSIIAVGSARPDAAEIDAVTVSRCARIVVESTEQAQHEAGDLLLAAGFGGAPWSKVSELGPLLAGDAKGRQSTEEITLFESLGLALEDVAIASLAYSRLCEQGKA